MRVNQHLILWTSALVLGTSAIAGPYEGEAQPDYPQPIVVAKDRAQVESETRVARAGGQFVGGEIGYVAATSYVALKTRAEVNAEAIEARRLGLVAEGEAPMRDATASEIEQIRLAGLRARAAESTLASK